MASGKTTGTRRARTAANRARMLGAARDLFTAHGYTATTMKAIADRAGMAVQTLYFTFATKRAILSELVDTEIAGDTEPVATLDRPWVAGGGAAIPRGEAVLQEATTSRILVWGFPLL
ncbi:helix-turn-helix domain-containing protein, partial [Streptomyces pharetrae]|uniref:helix-turn-helix domain-containing protein n=1 Tax=Streptomyces pharetrae TaxID=291370 RepID=UPI0036A88084